MINKEELKRQLEKELKGLYARIEAWKGASVKTKKDGSEFESLGRATVGCSVGKYSIIEDAKHPYLTVTYKADYYESDHLQAFEYLDGCNDDGIKERARVVYNQSGIERGTVLLGTADLNEKIKKYIAELEKRIQTKKSELDNFDEVFDKVKAIAKKAYSDLLEVVGGTQSTYYYKFYEVIKGLDLIR